MNRVHLHVTIRMNLIKIMLNEKDKSERVHVVSFSLHKIQNQEKPIYKVRSKNCGYPGQKGQY